jgi:hypothetical protein
MRGTSAYVRSVVPQPQPAAGCLTASPSEATPPTPPHLQPSLPSLTARQVQRNARHWPEPHSFRPERWLAEGLEGSSDAAEHVAGVGPAAGPAAAAAAAAGAKGGGGQQEGGKARPRAHAPFSEGQRSCVGQSLALMEMKSFLAAAVGRLTFRWASAGQGLGAGAMARGRDMRTALAGRGACGGGGPQPGGVRGLAGLGEGDAGAKAWSERSGVWTASGDGPVSGCAKARPLRCCDMCARCAPSRWLPANLPSCSPDCPLAPWPPLLFPAAGCARTWAAGVSATQTPSRW